MFYRQQDLPCETKAGRDAHRSCACSWPTHQHQAPTMLVGQRLRQIPPSHRGAAHTPAVQPLQQADSKPGMDPASPW